MQLKRLEISNFLAVGYAEIDLEKQGFVAIRGINNTDPNTDNCGTGKSSIANALHWVLIGTTVKGGTDVKNQYTEGDCAVSVEFEKNDKDYQIIRVKGKSLQLIENGQDIGGKGIRDTQALIESMFPEFTPEFIGATIIFGQKMPNAFTANTASKRKELLERLTRSDFQIEDIKERLTRKKADNAKELRKAEDENLITTVALRELANRKFENEQKKKLLLLPDDIENQTERLRDDKKTYEELLEKASQDENLAQEELDRLQKEGTALGDKIREHEKAQAELKERELSEAHKNKDAVMSEARNKSEQALREVRETLSKKKAEQSEAETMVLKAKSKLQLSESNVRGIERDLKKAEDELMRIEKSTVCPTCGKPWGDDEHKVDLEPYRKRIDVEKRALSVANEELMKAKNEVKRLEGVLATFRINVAEYEQSVFNAEQRQAEEIQKIERQEQKKIDEIKIKWEKDRLASEMGERLTKLRKSYAEQRDLLLKTREKRISAENTIKNIVKRIEENERKIKDYFDKLKELDANILKQEAEEKALAKKIDEIGKQLDSCKTRAEQINKLYNFAVKKFRTILLEDIITILEAKAKAIAQRYFGVDITFRQDGANIEITYQGKQFENLSGGEECAAVLVIQTALRELLADLTGEESNVLFIDEATDGADVALSERIMMLIGDYNTESVFIISHHGELNLPTDRTLVVEKNNNIAEVHWE